VTIKSDIVLWNDRMLKKCSQRLKKVTLPNNVKLQDAESGFEERFAILTKVIQQYLFKPAFLLCVIAS
jgi:hypothetical protein